MFKNVQKELNKHTTLQGKLKYLLFAYKFELIVTMVVTFFIIFFTHSILVHDTAVLNVGIYTSAKKGPTSYQTSSMEGKLNKVLKVNYSHHRDTVEVETGTTSKISDIAKMKAMLQAGELDILITSKNDFTQTKKQKKNYKVIPHALVKKVGKKNTISYKGRILGVKANKLSIFKSIVKSNDDVFCITSNGKNPSERDKLIDYMAK